MLASAPTLCNRLVSIKRTQLMSKLIYRSRSLLIHGIRLNPTNKVYLEQQVRVRRCRPKFWVARFSQRWMRHQNTQTPSSSWTCHSQYIICAVFFLNWFPTSFEPDWKLAWYSPLSLASKSQRNSIKSSYCVTTVCVRLSLILENYFEISLRQILRFWRLWTNSCWFPVTGQSNKN